MADPTASTPAAGPSLPAAPALAVALARAIDPGAIVRDLERLLEVTDAAGGARPAGSDAYEAAAAFVADELRAAGMDVELQPVELPFFRQTVPSRLEILGQAAPTFEDGHDFKAMLFSGSGDVTGRIFTLGFDRLATPASADGTGCNAADWVDVPANVIVLVQPARCRRHDVVVHAQAAGAVAIITAYPAWRRDGVLRPTLIDPDDIRIPAIGATHEAGVALAAAAEAGALVRVATHTSSELRMSSNVIAETPGGDPGHVVMLGGHLDSVVDGPGANDNGSGSAAIVEIARRAAAAIGARGTGPGRPWKVRVALFTGEEIGLWGSRSYVAGLEPAERDAIEAYINLDMLGSPNGLRLVYDGADSSRPIESGRLAELFGAAFDRAGLVWQAASVGGSSDHASFSQVAIPTGGLFSGGGEPKSATQADLFGGIADAPNDPCLHLPCDTIDNIDPVLLEQMARAAAWVAGALASGEVQLGS
jgi:aminopeptidase Y